MNRLKKSAIAILLAAVVALSGCGLGKSASERSSSMGWASQIPSGSSSESQPSSSAPQPKIIDGFVEPKALDSDLVVDLRYATTDNFTHQKIYPTDVCVLRVETANKLVNANAILKKEGYDLKIWDAYRPVSVQKIFWNIEPDDRYVADPYSGGSVHNKGCAVDVTLVDSNHNDVEMPSGFDDFTQNASPTNPSMSATAKADLNILSSAMTASGFTTLSTEWWHFDDSDSANYSIADIDLTQFQQ